jgi:hypothetical protein
VPAVVEVTHIEADAADDPFKAGTAHSFAFSVLPTSVHWRAVVKAVVLPGFIGMRRRPSLVSLAPPVFVGHSVVLTVPSSKSSPSMASG